MSEWKTRITKVQVVKPAKETGEACMVLIYPPGPDMGKRFPLSRNEVVLGRGGDCDVQVDRDSVSRRHARVFRSGDSWYVEDLQSTNGSYVNDKPVTKGLLHDGDFVKIGAAIFKFLMGTGIEASYHEEIYKMTIVDALTGAHNKRYFLEFLEREIARCARYRRPLSLLMFDIDHFKAINDTYGHAAGDRVLREAAGVLASVTRRGETLCRIGGEEFLVLCPHAAAAEAAIGAERMRAGVENAPIKVGDREVRVTISLGVAERKADMTHPDDLLRAADDALYAAKAAGRNRVATAAERPLPEPSAEMAGPA
jgi:diguanylate cyclase (GGDEF)-like protein